MDIINKYVVLDAKKQCQRVVALAKARPWGATMPWHNMYIAGGFIASHLQLTQPKDIDFYFEEEDSMNQAVAELLKHQSDIKEVDPQYREIIGRDGKMITEWAITMTGGFSFVTKHFGEPKELKKTFDYLHCCAHYDIGTDQLFISEAQYVAIVNKKLVVNNPDTFTNAREQKFLIRGYTK